MAEKKFYKIAVEGDLAEEWMHSMPELSELNMHRVSAIVFVVSTEGDSAARDQAINERRTPTDEDERAYLLDVMTFDEGTFPDLRARNVTGKNWQVYP